MNATNAVFLREVQARKPVLWLALAVAVLGFSVPFLPGVGAETPQDLWQIAAAVLAVIVGSILATLFGISAFGADLTEQRTGFFFTRPLSTRSIWFGRIAAIYFLVIVCEIIALVPGFVGVAANGGVWSDNFEWWPVFFLVPAALILASHAMSVMLRARSAWLILDLFGAFLTVILVWSAINTLRANEAPHALTLVTITLGLIGYLAFIFAGLVGLNRGRTDLQKTHGALSITLWAILGSTAVLAFLLVNWMVSFGPEDIHRVILENFDPSGRTVHVSGQSLRGLDVTHHFLVSTVDDRWVTLPKGIHYSYVGFSEDGSTASWVIEESGSHQRVVWRTDLAAPHFEPVETTIAVERYSRLFLSPDGRHLAAWREGLLQMYDLYDERRLWVNSSVPDSWNLVFSFDFPQEFQIRWLDEDEAGPLQEVRSFDVATGEVRPRQDREIFDPAPWRVLDSEGERAPNFNVCGDPPCSVNFRDPRPEDLPMQVALPSWAKKTAILDDGRLLAVDQKWGSVGRVGLESATSGGWLVHDFRSETRCYIGGELNPGKMLLFEETSGQTEQPARGSFFLFDLETGDKTHIVDGPASQFVFRMMGDRFWGNGGTNTAPQALYNFFINPDGALVRWDPETNRLTTIAGGAG